jgi:sugar fermentation stimulation protein A
VHREPTFGDSRFDLQLTDSAKMVLLEVKSCTLVVDGVAFFPDALTERGSRHLHTLTRTLCGGKSVFIFMIQRGDADILRPNRETDPGFFDALKEAQLKGVEVLAYNSKVTLESITINKRVPVKI